MSKRITAKTGEYQKDGQTKGRYVDIGVILSNANGEYILLDPTVNSAGVLAKQNAMDTANNKPMRDNVMCSIFDSNQAQGANQGYQQPSAAQPIQQAPQQQGSQTPSTDFDDDVPF